MDFDEKMVLIELERNRAQISKRAPQCLRLFSTIFEEINHIERFCTMRRGTALCNIPMFLPEIDISSASASASASALKKPPSKAKKFPKLSELFKTLFGEAEPVPENLHNSMVDVLVCLRCYLKMRHNILDDQAEHISQISSSS
jgi:hypothetical protein